MKSLTVDQKVKSIISYDPETPILDLYLKKLKTWNQIDICKPMLLSVLFTIVKM